MGRHEVILRYKHAAIIDIASLVDVLVIIHNHWWDLCLVDEIGHFHIDVWLIFFWILVHKRSLLKHLVMLVVLSAIINCSLGITLTIKCFFSQRVFSIVKIAISIVSINLLNLDFFINNVFQSLISFNLLGSHIMLMIRMDRQILVNNQMMVLCTSSIHHFSLSSIGIFWMEFQ